MKRKDGPAFGCDERTRGEDTTLAEGMRAADAALRAAGWLLVDEEEGKSDV